MVKGDVRQAVEAVKVGLEVKSKNEAAAAQREKKGSVAFKLKQLSTASRSEKEKADLKKRKAHEMLIDNPDELSDGVVDFFLRRFEEDGLRDTGRCMLLDAQWFAKARSDI